MREPSSSCGEVVRAWLRSGGSFCRPQFVKETAFLEPFKVAPIHQFLWPDFLGAGIDLCRLVEDRLKGLRLEFQSGFHDLDLLVIGSVQHFSVAYAQLFAKELCKSILCP
jgi:hypothetical protein